MSCEFYHSSFTSVEYVPTCEPCTYPLTSLGVKGEGELFKQT